MHDLWSRRYTIIERDRELLPLPSGILVRFLSIYESEKCWNKMKERLLLYNLYRETYYLSSFKIKIKYNIAQKWFKFYALTLDWII